jgi:hypothetical protein
MLTTFKEARGKETEMFVRTALLVVLAMLAFGTVALAETSWCC